MSDAAGTGPGSPRRNTARVRDARADTNRPHDAAGRLSNSPGSPWYADERFWRTVKPWLFPEPFWVVAPYEVDAILELTGVPADCRVLDLACGPGRVALQFAQRGARVTGVDLNQAYLDEAKTAASKLNARVDWVCADMRDFVDESAFDLVVCLYNSFGYFDDRGDDRKVLQNVCTSLAPGGRFVLDHLGREMCEHAIHNEPYIETRGGLEVEHRAELRANRSVLHCEWRVTGDGIDDRFVTDQHVYTAREIEAMVKEAGFQSVTCFGGYERSAYSPESDRLLAIAHK